MITGIKYFDHNVFYTRLKKHYCPVCRVKLERMKKSKVVNAKSPEAKNFDFNLGNSFLAGNVKFIWTEFQCSTRKRTFSIREMQQIEKQGKKR